MSICKSVGGVLYLNIEYNMCRRVFYICASEKEKFTVCLMFKIYDKMKRHER